MEQIKLDIGTIGQKLESARQEKGVSVSEAGHETKILAKYIEAMEADNFDIISAPVYVKGFIKIYAQYLGLNPEPFIKEYSAQIALPKKTSLPDELKQKLASADRAVGDGDPDSNKAKSSLERREVAGPSVKMIGIAVAGLVVLVAVILLVVNISSGEKPTSTASTTTTSSSIPVQPRTPLYEHPPEVYIAEPGKIEVAK